MDDADFDMEGDCPDCDGTGMVSCNCDDRGCSQCIDGERTCQGCAGSGFKDAFGMDLCDDSEPDGDGEPVGSCDDCGANLYGEEHYEGLCDQCSWARSQG